MIFRALLRLDAPHPHHHYPRRFGRGAV